MIKQAQNGDYNYVKKIPGFCLYKALTPATSFFKPIYHKNDLIKKMLFGVEYELEFIHEKKMQAFEEIYYNLKDWCIFTNDDSLYEGLEIKTAPASYETQMEKWDAFFNTFNPHNFLTRDDVGIHIHVSRKGFDSKLHHDRFIEFFYENQKLCEKFGQRNYPEYYSRYDKYVPINILHSQTLEVRIFKSTLRKLEFLKNLEFVHAIVSYTRKEQNRSFIDWFESNNSQYENLYRFLKMKGIKNIALTSLVLYSGEDEFCSIGERTK